MELRERRSVESSERYVLTGNGFDVELTSQKKRWDEHSMPGNTYYPALHTANKILARARITALDGSVTVIALKSASWFPGYEHDGPVNERYRGPFSISELLPDVADSRAFTDAFAEYLLERASQAVYDNVRRAPELDLTTVRDELLPFLVERGIIPDELGQLKLNLSAPIGHTALST